MNTILIIFGIFAIIWLAVVLAMHIFAYCNKDKIDSIKRCSGFYTTDSWTYVIPTFKFIFSEKFKEFGFCWLKWELYFCYSYSYEEEK